MYKIPEPSEDPISSLVMNYKLAKEIEYDDRTWDKKHWGRCAKNAKDLLEICKIYEVARRCLEELSQKFKEIGCDWNFATILSHAHDWKTKQEKSNDKQKRQRFLDALAQQRANSKDKGEREAITGREILGPLGNLAIFQDRDEGKDRSTNSLDGNLGTGT